MQDLIEQAFALKIYADMEKKFLTILSQLQIEQQEMQNFIDELQNQLASKNLYINYLENKLNQTSQTKKSIDLFANLDSESILTSELFKTKQKIQNISLSIQTIRQINQKTQNCFMEEFNQNQRDQINAKHKKKVQSSYSYNSSPRSHRLSPKKNRPIDQYRESHHQISKKYHSKLAELKQSPINQKFNPIKFKNNSEKDESIINQLYLNQQNKQNQCINVKKPHQVIYRSVESINKKENKPQLIKNKQTMVKITKLDAQRSSFLQQKIKPRKITFHFLNNKN